MTEDWRRSALSGVVAKCRRVLVGDRQREAGDIGEQLEAPYGFDPRTGIARPMQQMAHLQSWQVGAAEMLRTWHAHLMASAPGEGDAERARAAYDQMKYEIGYTVLHRLCALRMAEERRVIRECVGRGRDSEGFRLYSQIAGDGSLGSHEDAYAFYLGQVYDELGRDLPAVFDRRIAASLLFPRPHALDAVIAALSGTDLSEVWTWDEALGWIFEDYNDAAERKEMRQHDAPRNARELAVRNQFFTPRWVVEFLTDNTLGRLWYDLNGGQTVLVNRCRFLAKPSELPHAAGLRDPRDLKILDPACGSGHFLLYAYDLLETMYLEAWQGRRHRSPERKPLWEEFPDERSLQREIPRLILANNLHGVDIDSRCIQEAALVLWLRAQRSWQELGLKAKDRPQIEKVHLVCAQTLPSTPELRKELLARLKPAMLGRLVEALFLRIGEMGVLARAETAIADTVASVKAEYVAWKQQQASRSELLFPEFGPRQTNLADYVELQKMGEMEDSAFWHEAEPRLIQALNELAEEADEPAHYKSRLFADDVRHGLEFFELSRQKFDVILMNPPFGVPAESTKAKLFEFFPNSGGDLYVMFFERSLQILTSAGRVGAITSRTWIALAGFERFRRNVLGSLGDIELVADLGYGVLNAKVETAAAVICKEQHRNLLARWIRLVRTSKKKVALYDAVSAESVHEGTQFVWRVPATRFECFPSKIYAYWMSDTLANHYRSASTFAAQGAIAQKGAESGDDWRLLRTAWEITPDQVGFAACWARMAKGGEYRPFWDDIHLVIHTRTQHGRLIEWRRGNKDWFGLSGVTWAIRTTSAFGPRALPQGVAFSDKGPGTFPPTGINVATYLALLASRPILLFLSARLAMVDDSPGAMAKSYEVGLIRDLPWPSLNDDRSNCLARLAADAVELVRPGQVEDDDTGESVASFCLPPVLLPLPDASLPPSLAAATRARVAAREDRVTRLATIQAEIDHIVADAYGFTERDRQVMDEELDPPLVALTGTGPIDEEHFRTAYLTKNALDGERLPGGLDAEVDVRVEHRRGKQVRLRDEATLCRVFQAPPARIAEERRLLGLLRAEDLHRAAADILSYAVGVAFGRWDIRLVRHPEWIPAFADPFDPLPPCPLGQLVNADGLPATQDRIASEAWLAARKDLTRLPEGPADAYETSAGSYPVTVAWDGLLADDILEDTLPRRPQHAFLSRVEAVVEHLFGASRPEWEADMFGALGVQSLADWMRSPNRFFDDHLSRDSKSRRQAPIYWPLSTPSGGLTWWLYAPRLDADTLPSLVNRLRTDVDTLRDERDRVQKEAESDRTKLTRLELLRREVTERQELHDRLAALLARGYRPHPDDGFAITASPLHFAFRLAKWRETLKETWVELEKGDYDWAHLAMCFWPERVRGKCASDLSIAIAHGREDLHGPAETQKRTRKPAAASGGAMKGRKNKTAVPADQTAMPWKGEK